MIFARLRYKTVPESIPATLEGRAAYWKQHYNSYHPNAAGSSDGYISKCAKCDTATLLGSL
ncbi:hypothetical protein JCM19237_312 [Photobacterium aphoticum]|uniref:Uncharacterized protein n=1 Tax=Photobacterium aphoticum TaxID=754436 RepID=A0A090RKB8_9GAMM|nr:hypothetical protein JCM19237_312 [Photobacterium aphoticum]